VLEGLEGVGVDEFEGLGCGFRGHTGASAGASVLDGG
jgi:hypothetical protein